MLSQCQQVCGGFVRRVWSCCNVRLLKFIIVINATVVEQVCIVYTLGVFCCGHSFDVSRCVVVLHVLLWCCVSSFGVLIIVWCCAASCWCCCCCSIFGGDNMFSVSYRGYCDVGCACIGVQSSLGLLEWYVCLVWCVFYFVSSCLFPQVVVFSSGCCAQCLVNDRLSGECHFVWCLTNLVGVGNGLVFETFVWWMTS